MTSTFVSFSSHAPGEFGYDAATAAFNTRLTARPDLVVDARRSTDVVAAVRRAAEEDRAVTVMATGHGLVSDLAGSAMISTRHLDTVRVDPVTATAVVGGGATWAQVIAAAAPYGLAPVCGSASGVGVVGFLLGGGHGPLSREHGVGSDHLRRVRIVTGDGIERDVDTDRDPDLFAALRGGKAGFGVVTEVEIGLHPVTRLYGGGIFFPGAEAPTLLHAWRDWVETLPETATSSIALLRLPPDPSLPPPLQGAFVTHLRFSTTASADEGTRLLAPMRALAEPIADLVCEMPFTAIDAVHSDPADPMPVFEESALLGSLPAEAIDALLAVAGPGVDVPLIVAELRALGGAIDRRVADDSVAGRGAAFSLLAITPGIPVAPAVTAGVVDAVAPWHVGGLPNFRGASSGGQLAGVWDPATVARLHEVQRRYDPQGLFRRAGTTVG